ncbi:unnamed protein product [Symbiodinium sp. CCMP2456]|nr:unnamed protein product [Symbiodinium sp. CCMP2456]
MGKGHPSKGKKGPAPPPAATVEASPASSAEDRSDGATPAPPVSQDAPLGSGTRKDADAPLPDDEDLDVAAETSPASPAAADPAEEKSALHPVALQAAKGPPPAGKGKAKGPGKPAKGPPLPPAQG